MLDDRSVIINATHIAIFERAEKVRKRLDFSIVIRSFSGPKSHPTKIIRSKAWSPAANSSFSKSFAGPLRPREKYIEMESDQMG